MDVNQSWYSQDLGPCQGFAHTPRAPELLIVIGCTDVISFLKNIPIWYHCLLDKQGANQLFPACINPLNIYWYISESACPVAIDVGGEISFVSEFLIIIEWGVSADTLMSLYLASLVYLHIRFRVLHIRSELSDDELTDCSIEGVRWSGHSFFKAAEGLTSVGCERQTDSEVY